MSMFNWSGKQALGDEPNYSSSASQASSSDRKQANTGSLEAFDHTFRGEIHTIEGSYDGLRIFGNCAHVARGITIVCSAKSLQIVEEVSLSLKNKSEIPYRQVY